MGKGEKQSRPSGSGKGSSSQVRQLNLWEIDEGIISIHYILNRTQDGTFFYKLHSERQDLPDSFWLDDW
ncbi:hypothetical protein E4U41_005526 [Claviceps citrina]|nr:hypothetical protein E4U41_005526 [Claviceps citrina]